MFRKNRNQKAQKGGGSQPENQVDALSEKLMGLNTSDATDVDTFEHEKEKIRIKRQQGDEDLNSLGRSLPTGPG